MRVPRHVLLSVNPALSPEPGAWILPPLKGRTFSLPTLTSSSEQSIAPTSWHWARCDSVCWSLSPRAWQQGRAGHGEAVRWLSHGHLRMDMSTSGYGGTVRLRVSSEKSQGQTLVAHMWEWTEEREQAEEAEKQLVRRWQENQGGKVLEAKGEGSSQRGHPVPQGGHEVKTKTKHWICNWEPPAFRQVCHGSWVRENKRWTRHGGEERTRVDILKGSQWYKESEREDGSSNRRQHYRGDCSHGLLVYF